MQIDLLKLLKACGDKDNSGIPDTYRIHRADTPIITRAFDEALAVLQSQKIPPERIVKDRGVPAYADHLGLKFDGTGQHAYDEGVRFACQDVAYNRCRVNQPGTVLTSRVAKVLGLSESIYINTGTRPEIDSMGMCGMEYEVRLFKKQQGVDLEKPTTRTLFRHGVLIGAADAANEYVRNMQRVKGIR